MQKLPVLLVLFIIAHLPVFAQTSLITGVVTGENDDPIPGVNILIEETRLGTVSDVDGKYKLRVKRGTYKLKFTHIGYKPKVLEVSIDQPEVELNVKLEERSEELQGVEVEGEYEVDRVVSYQSVDSKSAKSLPSTFGDFNKVLVTLPGVSSNNELSSAYSVRGGNFAENLVYVNDIPVYRPFLANAGRQEGLSFVNPDLVQDIEFYAGGWEPKYGDKLSSSLNIEYKESDTLEAGVTVGLLGGTAYTGGGSDRFSYLFGVRHRDSRYLLNTLEVKGQYFPTYTDVQSLLTFDLSGKNSQFINKTKLNILLSIGRNRYLTTPTSQSTQFGSVQQNFRLVTAFEGREILKYNTYQTGFRLTHRYNSRLRTHFIGSALYTREKEYYDVEGAYRLCDVNTNPGTSSFDDCVIVRGIGTNYEYGRNSLDAQLYTLENRYEYLLNDNHVLEAGAGVNYQKIRDEVNEYTFIDSADYVNITGTTFNSIDVKPKQYFAYAQNTYLWKDSVHAISGGVRFTYWDYNEELLISPRLTYRFAPKWENITTFKFSTGWYQQPPFYRELRDREGNIQTDVRAQKSIHFIGSMTRLFYMWGRPFLFSTELYHKYLYDIIPYDIDNVRLRYYADNNAEGFAQGIDFRIHGEFVKGTQSWFSLGFLRTQEDIAGDSYISYFNSEGEEVYPNTPGFADVSDASFVEVGNLRRPTDQRINLAAYFEDHMPNDPTLRVYINMVFGSGYPFGPPKSVRYRNAFSGDEYYRVDLGLSKSFKTNINNTFTQLWLRLEVLNALAADNTLSYTWIEDVNGNQFAIPNSLSARFFNVKMTAEF